MQITISVDDRPDFDYAVSQVIERYKEKKGGSHEEIDGEYYNENYISNLPIQFTGMSITDIFNEEKTYDYHFEIGED